MNWMKITTFFLNPLLLLLLAASFIFMLFHPAHYSTSAELLNACLGGGLLAGVFAGMFGMGSIVLVPILSLVMAKSGVAGAELAHASVATSLAATCLLSALGVLTHARAGNIDFGTLRSLGAGAMSGAVIGALLSGYSRPAIVFGAIAAFQLLTVVALLRGWISVKTDAMDSTDGVPAKVHGVGVSSLIGLVTSFTGIGAGPVCTPYLLSIRMAFQPAVGTSLAISLATTVAASAAVIASGRLGLLSSTLIHWPEVVALSLGSALSIKFGAYLGRTVPMSVARNVLALLLFSSAAQTLLQVVH